MAVTTQGTAHLFGIQAGVGAVTNATVLSFSKKSSHANQNETVNEIGNVIEDRMDDIHVESTLVLRPRSGFTPLVPGAAYTFGGITYTVKDEQIDEQSTGFMTYTYTLLGREYITEA